MPSIAPVATPAGSPMIPSSIVRPPGGAEFTVRMHAAPEGKLPYRLYVPAEFDLAKRYPLIVWLHGAGGSGHDNKRQIEGDQKAGTQTWVSAKQQAAQPAFVLVPQTAEGWASNTSGDLTRPLKLVLQILDTVSAEYPIDPQRVYLLGQSMGGSGVWGLAAHHPERFAAAVLVCPVIHFSILAPKAAGVPMWVFMGERDGLAESAREAVAGLRRAGANPRYTEYAGAGHDIWTRVFQEPELPSWLFAQRR